MRFDLKSLLLVVTLASLTAAGVGAWGLIGACLAAWLWAAIVGAVAYRSRSGSWAVLALVMFLGGMFAVPVAFMEGHPVSMWRLNRVRVGMTERQVRETLGRPTSDEGDRWIYDSALTWCYVTIVFSEEGRVQEIVHDH